MTDTANLAERVKDLEEATLLLLATVAPQLPRIIEATGHGKESALVHRATVEEIDFQIEAKRKALATLDMEKVAHEADITALMAKRDEVDLGLL